jgi:hypothetical protein
LGLDVNKFSELTKDFENVERYPHITVLYGLPDDPNIVDYLKSVSLDFKDYTFQLSNISYFESNSAMWNIFRIIRNYTILFS